ncbi:hypothetical protein ACVW1K_002731 [Bacillus subtilis]|nr:hypothetical protein Q433_10795 [Bacillus subtilis subsp. subtilis str. OH 131.1]
MLFEDAVLTDPAEEAFLPNFLLLGAGTALVLCLVFFLYQKLDQSQFAVIKLGIWGSAVGLLMDTISLWNLPLIFPALSKGQVIAFTIWMVCAYCMYLLIPLILSHKK